MAPKRVIVLGARGVFGSLLVRELAGKYEVVPAGRGAGVSPAFAVACTAGPFQQLDRSLVRAAVEAGAHWLDIADDERWFFDLLDDRQLDALARERGVVVMPGLSTMPALSCALVTRLATIDRVTITLFIGNDNAKGAAAIASGAALHSPDRELLRRERNVDASVHTRFEMPGAGLAMRALRVLPLRARLRVAKVFARLAPRFGSSGGYLQVNDLRLDIEQRTAILPLVFALEHLEGRAGCLSPTVLDAEELLRFVER